MKKFLFLVLILLPTLCFSQQPLSIKGIHPKIYITHNVSSNETYASIARLYNITPSQVADYNDLTLHNGKIFARTLQIPLTSKNFLQKISPAQKDLLVPVFYMLNTNERTTNVLARFKVSVESLKELNDVTEQELANRKQMIVGYLRTKREAASFFGIQKESNQVQKTAEERQPEVDNQTDTSTTEQKETTGVREAKSRTDEKPATLKLPEVSKDTTAIATPLGNATELSLSQSKRLRVFIDCNAECDHSYIKTEINIVDFLLDRVASDVHMLITSQQNGNGGKQYQMIFYGQNQFKNLKDTLRFNVDPNATNSETRDAVLKHMKLGLTPFIARTDYAGDITIQMKKESLGNDATSNASTTDKWNYWVFNTGLNGNISLDQVYKSNRYNGNFSANRITDKLKVTFAMYGQQNVTKYDLFDTAGTPFIQSIKNSSYQFEHTVVKSINNHWSIAYEAEFSNSTFSNNKRRLYFQTAIEYSIFPYKEVNTRFFTLSYGVDVRRNTYYDSSVTNKLFEMLYGHSLNANISVIQKWGNISTGITYRNYLHDFNLNNLGLNFSIELRIGGGLFVNGYMFGELVGDQIYLPKERATTIGIITRSRQVPSNYNFYSGFGFSYRFGSKLSNFVNPRFNNL